MSDTPVTSTALVAGIIARLEAKVSAYAIEPYPDKPESYQLKHQKGAFLVAYRGSDYQEVDDTDAAVQVRRLLVDVTVLSRSLADAGGAYAMIEIARVALAGHRVTGFTNIVPVRERFLARDENVWSYVVTFATTTVVVELEDDVVATLLEQLTLVSPFATSEIPNA